MALITRFSRLLKADLHAVLDLVEEPEQMLAQAIRDMEVSVQRAELEATAAGRQYAQLERRIGRVGKWLAELAGELDVCFENSGSDELARAVLRKKLAAERLRAQLEQDRAALEAEVARLRERLRQQRCDLAELRQKAEVFAPCDTAHGARPDLAGTGYWPTAISDEDVEIALLRERAARSAP